MTETVTAATVADQDQRLRALDPAGSYIVQAPAGSGKTELLIQRFLNLLGTPSVDEPESVIAITFTRKAAGEMRHRLITALEDADGAEAGGGRSRHERQTRALAERVLERDEERGWRLRDHPSRLRIQTIDALSAEIVRRMPWVSRMGAPPRPEENAAPLYTRAARATLELLDRETGRRAASDALAVLLAHLDNNVGQAAVLLSAMLERRDQWLRHVVGNRATGAFRRSIESALEQVVTDELEQLAASFPGEAGRRIVAEARYAARNLVEQGGGGPIVACFGLGTLPGADAGDLDRWRGLAELLLTRGGERRTRLDRRLGFPATAAGRAAKQRCLEIPLDHGIRQRLHRIRSLPPVDLGDSRWEALRALMELLPVAVAQLKLVFQAEGAVDFTEIAHAAREALGSPEAPTELAFSLDCNIRHLLVDEFQDTSASQFELLEALTADWQTGDGRTLFLVGDPMQSIYGFRAAEVGLFLRARAEGVGNVRLIPLRLGVNFRSSAEIVDWVNRALGPAFPTGEDVYTGAVPYTPSVAYAPPDPDRPPPGSVTVHPLVGPEPDAEAETVLRVIREVRSSASASAPRTIAVLVRSRQHLFRTVSALRRAGERFRAVEIDALGGRPAVQDLLALTRALLHPGDRVSWLAVLRAPWCGLRLADLHGLTAGDPDSAVIDLMADPDRRAALSEDGRLRLERLVPIIDDAVRRRATMPIRRWIEGVWTELGGPASVDSRTGLEDAAAYLDLLERSVRGADLEDERAFELAVARLYARPDVEAGEDLHLLTIHKAKGLEFDTVILPGLGRCLRSEDAKLIEWLEYMDGGGRTRLLMAPIRESGSGEDPLYGYLRSIHSVKNAHEATRLLYVAATRARRSLHLLGDVGRPRTSKEPGFEPPDSRSLLARIWPAVRPHFERAFDEDGVAAAADRPRTRSDASVHGPAPVLRRLSLGWKPPPRTRLVDIPRAGPSVGSDPAAAAARHPTFDWVTELQRRVGIVVHAMLQRLRVDDATGDAPNAWDGPRLRAALAVEGLEGDNLSKAERRVRAALEATLADPRGRWILAEHEDDRREYALSSVEGSRVKRQVLDRTFVEDGVRWIIDYKTGVHEGAGVEAFLDNERTRYRAQLEGYARVMERIDSRPIRLGLYYPLLRGWREWAMEAPAAGDGPSSGF